MSYRHISQFLHLEEKERNDFDIAFQAYEENWEVLKHLGSNLKDDEKFFLKVLVHSHEIAKKFGPEEHLSADAIVGLASPRIQTLLQPYLVDHDTAYMYHDESIADESIAGFFSNFERTILFLENIEKKRLAESLNAELPEKDIVGKPKPRKGKV